MNDERFYDEVARELQNRKMNPGLWTKAFADADGDNDKARALYIRYRVTQLAQDEQRELQRRENEHQKQLRRAEHEREAHHEWEMKRARERAREPVKATERATAEWLENDPEAEFDKKAMGRVVRLLLCIALGAVVLVGLIMIFV